MKRLVAVVSILISGPAYIALVGYCWRLAGELLPSQGAVAITALVAVAIPSGVVGVIAIGLGEQ